MHFFVFTSEKKKWELFCSFLKQPEIELETLDGKVIVIVSKTGRSSFFTLKVEDLLMQELKVDCSNISNVIT